MANHKIKHLYNRAGFGLSPNDLFDLDDTKLHNRIAYFFSKTSQANLDYDVTGLSGDEMMDKKDAKIKQKYAPKKNKTIKTDALPP